MPHRMGMIFVILLASKNLIEGEFYVHGMGFQVRRLVKQENLKKLVDPFLGSSYAKEELCSMLHCASLCIRKDPNSRPRMSQV